MTKWLVRSVTVVVVAVAAVASVFLVGMRTKHPAVVHRIRRFNRAVTNPRVLRTAGSPGASASVIRHVGRRSGRTYDTPVGPHAIGDHFVIALPYGPGTDWVRNVLERGSAEMVHEGRTIEVHEPEIVSTAEVAAQLPSSERRTLRVFAVEQCLRVRGQDEALLRRCELRRPAAAQRREERHGHGQRRRVPVRLVVDHAR